MSTLIPTKMLELWCGMFCNPHSPSPIQNFQAMSLLNSSVEIFALGGVNWVFENYKVQTFQGARSLEFLSRRSPKHTT